ncbi:Nramp family divalent metal transporter [Flavobacteriaceae bacterium 14752]|uniref:Nramp family divalent metal transporter n=1 Tax=Mesohalobacter salilacus TaxID=2491711 RepID=UPI000F631F69|nr:divalent metal cation transporter [Flavobacteriaceae bacterium 14752]
MKILKNIGPGALIAAAFIGPGTVSVCALAGLNHGYNLIIVMFVSMFITLFLQELSARLAITFQKDLVELIQHYFKQQKFLKYFIYVLIFFAIVFGNAAYEAGNLSGINIGLQIMEYNAFFITILGVKINYAIVLISLLAFIILHIKSYIYIERTLMILVALLSISFIISAIITTEDAMVVLKGIFTPSISSDDILMVAALIGTTVVPYNLFLHASLAKQKWKNVKNIRKMRIDTFIAISAGILVSVCIIITTANVSGHVNEILELGKALEPLYGSFAKYLLGFGYSAAGLTSAITAPLAAAFVINRLFNLNYNLESLAFKRLSYFILFIGCIIAAFDFNPITVITLAQISNAIVLPIIALIIVWLSNKIKVLNKSVITHHIASFVVIIISLTLSFSALYKIILQ